MSDFLCVLAGFASRPLSCNPLSWQCSRWAAARPSFPQASSSSRTGCGAKDGPCVKQTPSYSSYMRKCKQQGYQEVLLGAHVRLGAFSFLCELGRKSKCLWSRKQSVWFNISVFASMASSPLVIVFQTVKESFSLYPLMSRYPEISILNTCWMYLKHVVV